MRVKLTNMLSIFADSLGQQASRFEPVVGHGCSPKANLIFPACLEKCLETKLCHLENLWKPFAGPIWLTCPLDLLRGGHPHAFIVAVSAQIPNPHFHARLATFTGQQLLRPSLKPLLTLRWQARWPENRKPRGCASWCVFRGERPATSARAGCAAHRAAPAPSRGRCQPCSAA